MPDSTLFTIDHDVGIHLMLQIRFTDSQLHRARRAYLTRLFSKGAVRKLETLIRDSVDKLTDALQTHKESGVPLKISNAYFAFTIDVITDYCFAKSSHQLDDHSFQKSADHAFSKAKSGTYWIRHFPWLFHVLKILPR